MNTTQQHYVNPADLRPFPPPPAPGPTFVPEGYALRHKPQRSLSAGELGSVVARARRLRGDALPDPLLLAAPPALPRTNGNAGAFVFKLYAMLEDPSCQQLISFSSHGKSFIIFNATEFSRQVLHKHFKHSNFSSFVRQCNMYGFHKVNKTPRGGKGSEAAQAWEFSHPKFIKGRPDLLETIKRKAMDDSLTATAPLTPPPSSTFSSWSPLSSPNPSTTHDADHIEQPFSNNSVIHPSPVPSVPASPQVTSPQLTLPPPPPLDGVPDQIAALQQQVSQLQDMLLEGQARQQQLASMSANLYYTLQQRTGYALPFEFPNDLLGQEFSQATRPPPILVATHTAPQQNYYFPQRDAYSSSFLSAGGDGLGISALPASPITPSSYQSSTYNQDTSMQ